MLRRTSVDGGQRVEFVVKSDAPVSVVGDFNDWDPGRGALTPMSDDALAWATFVSPGRYAFRYLCNGNFFDDPDADAYEANGYGQTHGVLIVEVPPADGPHEAVSNVSQPSAGRPNRAKAPSKPRPRVEKAPGAALRKPRTPRKPPTSASADLRSADRDLISSFTQATRTHPYLAGSSVTFSVRDQVIHLEGTVATRLAKQALWELAWGLRQIRDVRDDVVICGDCVADGPLRERAVTHVLLR